MKTDSYQKQPNDTGGILLRRRFGSVFSEVYSGSSWLTITGILMLIDTLIAVVGLVIDPTIVTGAPAWLKPLKFGMSTSLFCFTIAYIIGCLVRTRRFAAIFGKTMAVALVPEIGLIDMQAARHTTSHFNTVTAFDRNVYAAMGSLISVVLFATLLLFVAACVEHFADRALGWAIRLGLVVGLLGMGTGVFMTLPTPQQLAEAHQTGALVRAGGHTVGGPDGGSSLPVTGWSADHGDLRIAHFVGLHAMQALLLAWWLTRERARWSQRRQVQLIAGVAASIMLAFSLVLWQALRGQPILRPDTVTLSAWATWLAALVLGLISILKTNSAIQQIERQV